MAKIMVYQVQQYDITTDNVQISRRWWTKEGAAKFCFQLIESSGVEIEEPDLEPGEQWTPIGYVPKGSADGIQRHVLP
ncbi:hypothetical protein [Rhizobium bangladeshense]|uniref:hypothetical protein n=1 Tax=Rhizobium bangladeshense TaxID=1138189 RepID=UPI001C92B196|nr:hypothetical protein [Rhizobium bangladeshense]MBY3614971.1 hypothetical protein [Rhizobium bangladeshense]